MVRRKTQEEFVEQANKIHNNFYDYSKTNYISVRVKIIIVCPLHGEFLQNPSKHLRGNGCPDCGNEKMRNKQNIMGLGEFIKRANIKHSGTYDYSNFVYDNNKTKGVIICPMHGCFYQTPSAHLKGSGCPKCFGNVKKTKEKFIEEANRVHNNKYDYSKFVYKNNKKKGTIICSIHGEFSQSPSNHLKGRGCKVCGDIRTGNGLRKNKALFVKRAEKIHGYKYDYSKFVYVANNIKGIIICPKHGEFFQEASSHIKGCGCPKCSSTVSNKSQKWLNFLKIPEDWRENTIKINGKMYKPDALDKENQIVYEFYGDFWHGNPEVFDKNKINVANNKTFKFLYEKTLNREKELKKAGYDIVSIWEKEFDESYV